MLVKGMFVYHFVDRRGWENLWKKSAAEKWDIDFEMGDWGALFHISIGG